jgi:hypothetical protein
MRKKTHLLFILGVALLTSCANHRPTQPGTAVNPVFGQTAEIVVLGAVRNPGSLVIARDATFHDVLVAAGGVTDVAVRDRLRIVRIMDESDPNLPVDSPPSRAVDKDHHMQFIVDPSKPEWSPLPWRTGDALIVSSFSEDRSR